MSSPLSTPESDANQIVRASEIGEFMFELRCIARNLLAGERGAQSIAPTMLVHTAFYRNTVRNNQWSDVTWHNRHHFFADMIRAMRRALIDRVRRIRAVKRPPLEFRGPDEMPVDFPRDLHSKPEQVALLEEAMEVLEGTRPDLVRIVQHHYYVGLTTHEIAALLDISEKTVDRELKKARLLLADSMKKLASR